MAAVIGSSAPRLTRPSIDAAQRWMAVIGCCSVCPIWRERIGQIMPCRYWSVFQPIAGGARKTLVPVKVHFNL